MLSACQALSSNIAGSMGGGTPPPVALTEYNVYNAA